MGIKTSADWRIEIDDLSDSNQALIDVAEADDRDLSADEKETFESTMVKLEESKKGLADAVRFEAAKREIVATRLATQEQPKPPKGGLSANGSTGLRVQHRIGPLTAFSGQDGAKDAYDSGMWLRALVARANRRIDNDAEAQIAKRGWDVQNVATEGTSTAGGFLVPTPLSNAIIDVRALAGVSRQVARIVPMTAETQLIAKKDSGTTVYYPGEATAITESDQVWSQITLTAVKRAILSKISQELKDDAVIAVIDDLASQMGTDFAVQEDNEFINGDGTGTYGDEEGLLNQLGAAGVSTAGNSTWATLDIADFVDAMGTLPDRFWQFSPAWICSSAFYFAAMLRVAAEAGGNTIATLEAGAGGRPMFLGYPVFFTNQMPTATAVSTVSALFGSFNQAAIIGDRLGIAIAQSEHLGFAEDVLAVRATTRYDINVHEPGDGSDAGAYVGLSTSA